MGLAEARTRVLPLKQLERLTSIERKRIARLEQAEQATDLLQQKMSMVAARQMSWDTRYAKATPYKRGKMSPRPTETAEIIELHEKLDDLLIQLGDVPQEFKKRVRPSPSTVTYPTGPKHQFIFHVWMPLPTTTGASAHRSKGGSEPHICAHLNAVHPKGGRFDYALGGGESAEGKDIDVMDVAFRGGAHARRCINEIRHRVVLIIHQAKLLEKLAQALPETELHKIRYANHLLADVEDSLLSGNMHDHDLMDLYNALGFLNQVQWSDVVELHGEDELIRHPQGVHKFCRWVESTMTGSRCFFTHYIFLARKTEVGWEWLVIPRVDYDKCLLFLHLSKNEAHFKYFQPEKVAQVTSLPTQDLADVAAE